MLGGLQILQRLSLRLKAPIDGRLGQLEVVLLEVAVGPGDIEEGQLRPDASLIEILENVQRIRLQFDLEGAGNWVIYRQYDPREPSDTHVFQPHFDHPMILFICVDVIELGQDFLQQIGHFVGGIVAVVLLVPVDVVEPVLQRVRALVQVNSILPGSEMFPEAYIAKFQGVTAATLTSFAR